MSKTNFQKLIDSEKPVLIDFYADWCGPCKAFAPVLKELKQQVGDQVRVIKIDVDKNPNIAGQLQVRSIPTVMIFQKGQLKWRAQGGQSLEAMKQQLAAI
jgi:thioredoxin 1